MFATTFTSTTEEWCVGPTTTMDWCVLYLITISMNITAREHLNHNYSTNIRKKAENSKLFNTFFSIIFISMVLYPPIPPYKDNAFFSHIQIKRVTICHGVYDLRICKRKARIIARIAMHMTICHNTQMHGFANMTKSPSDKMSYANTPPCGSQ